LGPSEVLFVDAVRVLSVERLPNREAEPGSVEKIADQVAVQEAIHAACLQSVKQMVRELEEIISDLNVSVFEAVCSMWLGVNI
jgi:hypothetical protein